MADSRKVEDFNIGRVKVTIQENTGGDGSWLTASFLRLYKKDEKWKTTPRFKRDDLPSLAEAAMRAQERMEGDGEKDAQQGSVVVEPAEEATPDWR
jgi:hypothetical protein